MKSFIQKNYLLASAMFVLLAGMSTVLLNVANISFAAQTSDKSVEVDRYKNYTFYTATTTNATTTDSNIVDTKGANKVELYFTRNATSTSAATSTFSIEVSPDGTNWYGYNKLISNVTNTNSQDETRVASVQIVGATSTSLVSLDLQNDVFNSIRCISTFASTTADTTDSNTCTASIEY